MSLDMHSKVKIQEVLEVELSSDTVFIRVSYKVKHGRKLYKIWLLPSDFRGTGIFPLSYRRMTKYADVLDANENVIYTGLQSTCRDIVKFGNEHYEIGA
jgi:hypothetical protein